MRKTFSLFFLYFVSMTSIVYSNSNPDMSRVRGNQFTSEFMQTQLAAPVGSLDTTFNASNSYIIPTNGNYTYAVQSLSDGTFITLSSSATNSWLSKYTAEGSLYIAGTGFGTSGVLALSGYSTVGFMMLDPQNRLLISGADDKTGSHYPWIQRIEANGTVDSGFSFVDGASWTSSGQINQLAQQTTGQIIAVGFNGSNAMVARYRLNGTLDTLFGTALGYTILDGSTHTVAYPTSTVSLYSVVVDANDNIYLAYVDATPSVNVIRLTRAGIIDATWNSGNPVTISYLNGTSMVTSQLRMIIDSIADLVITVPSGAIYSVIKAASITSSTGSAGSFANVTMTSGVFGSSSAYDFRNMMSSSDGSVYFIGSNITTKEMMVARYTSAGILDTAFATGGVNFFNIGSPTVNALLYSGSIAPTGEIYAAGSQSTGGGPTITPYLSRLNNSQYVTQTAQFPSAQEQGILDQTFGAIASETYAGVTSPINGLYASCVKQQAVAAIEVVSGVVTHGDILIGLNGLTSNPYGGTENSFSNMMFTWLTQEGAVDTSAVNIPASGSLSLDNTSSSNEYMTSIVEDGYGNVYVAGYTSSTYGGSSNAAILRSYSSFTTGAAAWEITPETGSGWQGIGVSYQYNRNLLCVAESSTVGHISGYTSSGTVDHTFGVTGSGKIQSTSYGLNMGPCYGLAVNRFENIFAAYVDSSTSYVNVVKFVPNGSGLDAIFGGGTAITNIFTGHTVLPQNVRVGFDEIGNILVAATDTTNILIACLDFSTGAFVPGFHSGAILVVPITGSSSLNLTRLTGVSDGTILVTCFDAASDDTMLIARITPAGALDVTFNSQGDTVLSSTIQPGVLSIKIGDKVADYNARVATTALVQSTAGANQGNIVLVGYESVTSSDATPMAMRIYGEYGTQEVLDYYMSTSTPGTFQAAFNVNSYFDPNGNATAVYVYPSGNTYAGYMLLVDDNGLITQIVRLRISDMTVDTTFGDPSNADICTIAQVGPTSITIDKNNNILVGGTNPTGPVGWAYKLDPNGRTTQTALTMPSGILGVQEILQQNSGRYIIAASKTSLGVLIGFQDKLVGGASTLAVDPTFNPLATGGVSSGQCNVGSTTGLYTLAIAADDTIAVAYTLSGVVQLGVFTADGSGYSFDTFIGAPFATVVNADNSSVVQVAFDNQSPACIVVAGTVAASHQLQVARYISLTGVLDPTWNFGGGTGNVTTVTNLGSAGVTLATMMQTTTRQTVMVGYNTAQAGVTHANGPLFAVRMNAAGILDPTFNTPAPVSGSDSDTPGVLTYQAVANTATTIFDGAIEIDGTIVSVGGTSDGTSGSPIVTFVVGDPLVTALAQQPQEAAAGTTDLTIPGSTSGAMPTTTLPGGGSITGVPQKIYIYNSTVNSSTNGAMLIASTDATHVYITELNADLSLSGTHSGSSGFGTLGVISFTPNAGDTPTSVTVTDLFVTDANLISAGVSTQPIYVAGYTVNAGGVNRPFAMQIDYTGTISTVVAPVAPFTSPTSPLAGSIRQSKNSRVLVSGYNGTKGIITAYESDMIQLDTSFGNNSYTGGLYGSGIYVTPTASGGIYAMGTDDLDRIYIAYKLNATTLNIQRLLANGTTLDTSFTGAGTVTLTGTAWSATQIKLAIDLTNQQFTVAAVDTVGGFDQIKVSRFTFAGATADASTPVVVSVASKNLALSDLFIDNDNNLDFAGAYPNIYVIGTNTTDNNSIVARIATTSTTTGLDATYGSSGIANLAKGAMTVVTAGALDPDRRVYMVGSGSGLGYMARNYGDYYWTEMYPAITQGAVGAIDTTLYPNNTGGIDLSGQTGWSSLAAGYTAYAIIENPNNDGTSYIAFGNGTNLLVGQVNADMIPVATGFGTAGLTASTAMQTVTSMSIDSLGNICVAGTSSTPAQVAVIFTSAGALATTTPMTTATMTVGTTIAQQKSGRYIVGGYNGTIGTVCAYKNFSALSGGVIPVDPTFGPATLTGNYYSTGVAAQIDDLCIDSNDYIYIVYRDSGTVYLEKLTADGSAIVNAQNSPVAFNGGARLAVGIASATQPARVAINSAGDILVGASTSTQVKFCLFSNTGIPRAGVQTLSTANSPVLTKLVGAGAASGTNLGTEFYGSVSCASSPVAVAFAVLGATVGLNLIGTLDTSFGASGYLNTDAQAPTSINGLSVQDDGKVVMVGGNVTPDPILIRGYGYPYIEQFAQQPDQAAAGTLDTTLWPTTGALELDNYSPISTAINAVSTLATSSVSRIYEYSNGNALLVFSGTDAGADTVVARVLKDLTLDTISNGGAGFNSNTGFIVIEGQNNANALFVDEDLNIFVAGGSAATSWIRAYTNTGAVLTGWTAPTSYLALGANQVAEQTSERVILAGQNVNGTLVGYTNAGVIDNTFGVNGLVDMGSAISITDIAIDSLDNILAVSTTGTVGVPANVILQKVTDSGSDLAGTQGIATVVTLGAALANSTGNPKVILDSNSATAKIIIASATTAGFTIARYINDNTTPAHTGNSSGAQISIAAGGSGTSHLGNIYATSDGKVVLVGYETTGNTVVVVRLTSGFVVDPTFGNNGVMATTVGAINFLAMDGIICADDRVMLAGGSGAAADPYLVRSFGDAYVSYVTQGPAEGVAGTIDPTWGNSTPSTGIYDYSALVTANSQGEAILALADGGYYMALSNPTNSQLVRTVAEGGLDLTYGLAGSGIAETPSVTGVNSMMMDGTGCILLTGTTGGGAGTAWVAKYVSGDTGTLDEHFGLPGTGVINPTGAFEATVVIEQSLGRYIVAGKNASGAILYAYTGLLNPADLTKSIGLADTTFNAVVSSDPASGTPGYYQIPTTNGIYCLISDQWDRLIFAVLDNTTNNIDLYRLTPTGELDATFGSNGVVASVFSSSNSGSGFDASSIRVVLDSNTAAPTHASNIVVAAYVYDGVHNDQINIAAYDNGTSTGAGVNGAIWTNAFAIPNLVVNGTPTYNKTMSLTALAATSDNNVLVLGNILGTTNLGGLQSPTWIARLANTAQGGTYSFTGTTFNPSGNIPGIFEYSNTTLGDQTPYNVYNAMTVRPDGRIGVIGYEENSADGGTSIPTVLRVYDTPYTVEEIQFLGSKIIGTNDITFGASLANSNALGIAFFGIGSSLASYGQVARAIALQDDNNLVVAIDGGNVASPTTSHIFINKFDNDGILNPSFNSTGQATISLPYQNQNQNVQDMVTFTTVAGVHKAILAGYVHNTTLNSYDSLLLQYDLDAAALDSSFGGFNGNLAGIAFGDGQQINVVGRQTTGRIIAAGQSQNNLGLLLGYTAAGKLDNSFATGGYLTVPASTALFAQAVDTDNRLVIAYRGAGDTVWIARYVADGSTTDIAPTDTTISVGALHDNYMRVAVDASNNIYVAATDGATVVKVVAYNGITGAVLHAAFALPISVTAFTIAQLIIDTNGNATVVGYNASGTKQVVITRVLADLSDLDTTFNPSPAPIPGCLKYVVAAGSSLQQATDALIHPDGRIIVVGAEN